MKKIVFSTLVIACSVAISACSSTSSNNGSNKVDKTEYTQLQSEVTSLRKAVSELQTQLSQSKSTNQATIAQLQSNLEKAIIAAVNAGDVSSKKALEDLKNQLNQAQKNADKAAEEAKKAQTELDKTKLDKQLITDLTPISKNIFGGETGLMTTEKGKVAGAVLSRENGSNNFLSSKPETRQGLTYISVLDKNGSIVDVAVENSRSGFNKYLGGDEDELTGGIYNEEVRYGIYNYDDTGSQHIYVQGSPTDVAQIPTSGVIEYKGNVGHLTEGKVIQGNSYASVDFLNKVVTIEMNTSKTTMYPSEMPQLAFQGKLTNNTIAATNPENVKLQAGFFGENAKYLSGIYKYDAEKNANGSYKDSNKKDFQGVFGLTKSE